MIKSFFVTKQENLKQLIEEKNFLQQPVKAASPTPTSDQFPANIECIDCEEVDNPYSIHSPIHLRCDKQDFPTVDRWFAYEDTHEYEIDQEFLKDENISNIGKIIYKNAEITPEIIDKVSMNFLGSFIRNNILDDDTNNLYRVKILHAISQFRRRFDYSEHREKFFNDINQFGYFKRLEILTQKHAENFINELVYPKVLQNHLFNVFKEVALLENFNFVITFLGILILSNLLFKITAAPFHFWAPSVYEGAPLAVVTFLSIFSKIVIVFLIIKLYFYVFFVYSSILIYFFLFTGVLSLIVSIYGAIYERKIKRFLVYSSIGHMGYVLLGIACSNYDGISAVFQYITIYFITSYIVWFILISFKQRILTINELKNLSTNNPILAFILLICFFSMSGLPPLAGFIVKFEILNSLLNVSYIEVVFFSLLLSVISFFYYLRIVKIVYFDHTTNYEPIINYNSIRLFFILAGTLFLMIYMFVFLNSYNLLFKDLLSLGQRVQLINPYTM